MLRRLGSSGAVRTAACAAALLSLTLSVGLHPEPAGGDLRASASVTPSGSPRVAPHVCFVCLLQAPAIGPAASLVPGPATRPVPACQSAGPAPSARPAPLLEKGRAPPALV